VEKVISTGNSCHEAVLCCGTRLPEFAWYAISGTVCDLVQFAIDVAARKVFGVSDPSACWVISLFGSIAFR